MAASLFCPLKIRNVEIRNRILSTGHQSFLAVDGRIGDALIAYHEARAKGGAGLIIVESARFHESSISAAPEVHAHTDAAIDGYRLLAQRVHAHGAKLFGQLSHSGRCSQLRTDGVRGVVYAPSSIPDNRFHTMPRAMPTAMVQDIIESCGEGARRMAEAGLDGVEILVSHGLLFAQFINPQTNRRDDEFGGSFENRMRPLTAALELCRNAFGQDRVVGIRISAEEHETDGMDADLVLDVCRYLARNNFVDYINTTTGSMAGPGGSIHVVPPMELTHAYVAPKAAAIRAEVNVPVFVAGRINQPQEAELVLAKGQADMCGMTRAMIADPDMPNKARNGQFDDIRACIACNQGCIGHFHQGASITCIQNPVSGRETRLAPASPTLALKRVLIVGGGPAGMKAAVTARSAGHEVILCEASTQLGGQANLAAQLPGRAEFGGLVSNLARELDQLDVEIRLKTKVTPDYVRQIAPDAVILATGSVPFTPDVDGLGEIHCTSAHEVLGGESGLGKKVVVADWRCDWIGIGVALRLAQNGHDVQLAVNGLHAGQNLQPYQRDVLVGQMHQAGVSILANARLFGADADTVYLQHTITGDAILCDSVDTLVLAYGTRPEILLESQLADSGIAILLAGDCLSPRTAEEAILEGMRAALSLDTNSSLEKSS
ncbi:2,4-dienoyl-CoA reductase [Shimia gijangensis]|uniref:2,4-dienoyl-CoA reductase n=1 Tax=Shimia gijangensis TaxID=1470563 RepID=A0A1M6S3M6_9RHOB|nr:FAD-dependent oxidoreductase [Shimia gijangensis]SHK39239.1 2,4-dienoyl-CoA reductase [Shimia gijangensis]